MSYDQVSSPLQILIIIKYQVLYELQYKFREKHYVIHAFLDVKRAFKPSFEKLQKNLKKYVYQHDSIAILANHPVKKV